MGDGSEKCINQEIPFEIPENWEWCRLGTICSDIQYGLSNSAEAIGTHKLLRITDIQDGAVDWDKVQFTTIIDKEIYRLKNDDIVFARTGATVGKSFLIKNVPINSVYASYLIRIRLDDSLSPEYIYHFFQSKCYWTQIIDKAVGVGQPNCNGSALRELLIPLPPAKEQNKIADKTINIMTKYVEQIEVALI